MVLIVKKKRRVPKLGVPKDLKPLVFKKFKSRADKRLLVVATRIPNESGFAVATIREHVPTVVREFPLPHATEIDLGMWKVTQMQLAKWYANHLARKGQPPSVRAERSRRKKFMKKALAVHQDHSDTKRVVRAISGRIRPPAPPEPPVLRTFICVYDPNQKIGSKTWPHYFHLHEAGCKRLDSDRRQAGADGDSWVLEANTAEEAVADQLQEFDEESKGFDRSDFAIHQCSLEL